MEEIRQYTLRTEARYYGEDNPSYGSWLDIAVSEQHIRSKDIKFVKEDFEYIYFNTINEFEQNRIDYEVQEKNFEPENGQLFFKIKVFDPDGHYEIAGAVI